MTFTRQWIEGMSAEELKNEIVQKRFLGIPFKSTMRTRIPSRAFDSRNGDEVPEKVQGCTARYEGTFPLLKLYLYPGEDFEVPTFDHLVGRRSLHSERTLMATLMLKGTAMWSTRANCISTNFDETAAESTARIAFTERRGPWVYPGPVDVTINLVFPNKAVMKELTVELAHETEVEAALAAA